MAIPPGPGLAVQRVGRALYLLPASLALLAVTGPVLRSTEDAFVTGETGWAGAARALFEDAADSEQGTSQQVAAWLLVVVVALLVALVVLAGGLAVAATQSDVHEARALRWGVFGTSAALVVLTAAAVAATLRELPDEVVLDRGTVLAALLAAVTTWVVHGVGQQLRSDV